MMWALLLIFSITGFTALFLEDFTLSYAQDIRKAGKEWKDDPVGKSLEKNFSGMVMAWRSLIYAISGGQSWGELAEPFWGLGILPGSVFNIYLLMSMFGMLNVLVGIFVQESGEVAQRDKDLLNDDIMETREKQAREITVLFDTIDFEKNGWLSLGELSMSLKTDQISAFFEHLDVSVSKTRVLFKLLDLDGNGKITRQEFVCGLTKLCNNGDPEAVASLLLEEQRLNAKIDDLRKLICQHFETLKQI